MNLVDNSGRIEILQDQALKLKYIIAVSGGVDSVVLLHKIMSAQPKVRTPQSPEFIVAHFDHGIRADSADDAHFVGSLAKKCQLEYVTQREELGAGVSEDVARKARYTYLEKVMKENNATGIITAHHQDDVLETMVVNIIRGTSARGLIGYTRRYILRPLLHMTKVDIKEYAKENKLEWREDSTNQDQDYLRNYVRLNIMPKLEPARSELLELREKVIKNYIEIDDQIGKLLVQTLKKGALVRNLFVIYPYVVQKELMATYLRIQGIEINKDMVEKAVNAAKTLAPGKHIELQKNAKLYAYKHTVILKSEKR